MLAYCTDCEHYVAVENVHLVRGPDGGPVHRCVDCVAEPTGDDERTAPIVPHTGQSTSVVT
jgi:hypothetical protein